MKMPILFCAAVAALAACAEDAYLFAYFSNNGFAKRKGEAAGLHLAYSYDGLKWTALNGDRPFLIPEVGADKLLRDPSIARGPDGTFHMVWTCSWHDRIIGHASSKDLIHWSEQKAIPVMAEEKDCRNTWAPEVTFDPEKELFYIYWASTVTGRHSPIPGMDQKERGLNHRIYMTATKDWESFTPARIWCNPDFSIIDAALLRVQGGPQKWLMVLKNENHTPPEKNIRTMWVDDIDSELPTATQGPITGHWVEGPSPLQIGSSLFVYYDCYTRHRYGAVRSDDMGKTWRDISDEVSFPKGMRHGTAFAVDKEVVERLIAAEKVDGSNPLVTTRFTADPAGYVDGDWLYVFMGHDDDNAGGYVMRDWSVVRTKDTKEWEDLGTVLSVSETFPWAKPDGAWASQAIKRNGKWFWYVAVFRKGGQSGVAVATADDVKGPWTDPVGGPLVEGAGYIDPSVFIDDDGQAWLFWGNCGGDPGCWYAPLKENMIELAGEVKPVPGLMDEKAFGKPLKKKHGAGAGKPIDTNFEEAPWIYKLGDTYYLEFAAGGVPEFWAYSTAPSIHGPWTYRGRIMDEAEGTGTIHGGSVFFKGEWYMLHHNATLLGGDGCRRSACIERYKRNSDGSIPFIPATKGLK